MKLSSTKLKVFGGWIVVLMCIMAFSSNVFGSESIPKDSDNYKEWMIENLGKSHSGYADEDIRFRCSPKRIRIRS